VRLILRLLFVLLSLPGLATAQPETTPPAPLPGLGPIGLPLPPIGLPLPRIGLPPAPEPVLDRNAGRFPPRSSPPPRHAPRPRQSVVFVVPPYPWAFGPPQGTVPRAPVPGMPSPQAEPQAGRLLLDIEPADLPQVFVDGVYVGTLGDLRHEIELQPGTRRIELRASGYEPLTVDVQVGAGRAITYRGTLDRAVPDASAGDEEETPAPPAVVPTGSRTIYAIPGCYLGNVHPKEVTLPAGCDPARVRVHTP
jgi:hypothetical protein